MADDPQYTFLPWLRRGIATEISATDHLGLNPDDGELGRSLVPVELVLEYTELEGQPAPDFPAIDKAVQIVGPGDIRSLKSEAILRVHPYRKAVNFETNALAYVEFYAVNLPWRYTPAAATADHRLRPWLALWVLKAHEFERIDSPPDDLQVIRIGGQADPDNVLPPSTESWAWAHVHVNKPVAAAEDVPAVIEADPDCGVSRLLCPRKLDPRSAYHAFLVPAFETGRLAGLGELAAVAEVAAQKPSWTSANMAAHATLRNLEYPVYYEWSFKTGEGGDFETLARKLDPQVAKPGFGKRAMDVRKPGFGMDDPEREDVEVEAALSAPSFERVPFSDEPGERFDDNLESVLDLAANLQAGNAAGIEHPFYQDGADAYPADPKADPILVPPTYGKWHAARRRLADTTGDATVAWLRELNLDPRSRAAAGLGTQVVRNRQEQLMERAWEQVGRIEDANQRLREAELASALNKCLFRKHVISAPHDRLLTLTAAAQRGVRRDTTVPSVHQEFRASRVPTAAKAAAFKRIARPQQKRLGRFTEAIRHGVIDAMNREEATAAVSAARPLVDPDTALAYSEANAVITESISVYHSEHRDSPKTLFMQLLRADLAGRLADPALLDDPVAWKAALKANVATEDPAVTQQIEALIDAIADDGVALDADAGTASVKLDIAHFDDTFGTSVRGKSYNGVTVERAVGDAAIEVSRMTDEDELVRFKSDLLAFESVFAGGRPLPARAPALRDPATLARELRTALQPDARMVDRVRGPGGALRNLPAPAASQLRKLRPVMAYPEFIDPTFENLRAISPDWIIANFTELKKNSITLLESNPRFIESFMAGLNHEMSRELLWREFPTDLRGTYFRRFFDTRDALQGAPDRTDIKTMHTWRDALGDNSPNDAQLVLVLRGELLQKYPNTVVYAQKARFQDDRYEPRKLKETATEPDETLIKYPIYHAELEPDVALFGFDLDDEEARGSRVGAPSNWRAGWFFVLQERPGHPGFGFDEDANPAVPPIDSDDVHWSHVARSNGFVSIADSLTLSGDALVDADWGANAAEMAFILYQSPVLYARHAEEMLPEAREPS